MAKGGGIFRKFWITFLIVGLLVLAGIVTVIVLWATGYFKGYGALNFGQNPYVKNVSLDENNNVVVELRSIPNSENLESIGIDGVDVLGNVVAMYNGTMPSGANPQPIVVPTRKDASTSVAVSVSVMSSFGMCGPPYCYATYGPFYLKKSPNIAPTAAV
jgi:hypothetical protein